MEEVLKHGYKTKELYRRKSEVKTDFETVMTELESSCTNQNKKE